VINIKGYSPAGLSQIFVGQLDKIGYQLIQGLDIDSFFIANIKQFPNFGGDTSKLAYQCQQSFCELHFESEIVPDYIVNRVILQNAFKEFKANQVVDETGLTPEDEDRIGRSYSHYA
jgi:hypothetical protein